MSDDGEMTEIVTALLETEPFQWSQERAALSVEPDENVPNTINVVAGVPDEGDWEFLLEQWLTAALIAIPGADVEGADIVAGTFWRDGPESAVTIRLSLPESSA